MTSTSNDMRPMTAAEIDSVAGGKTVHYPPPNENQIVVTTSPGYFQVTTPNSTITATSSGTGSSISQSASTGTGSGFSSISTT